MELKKELDRILHSRSAYIKSEFSAEYLVRPE